MAVTCPILGSDRHRRRGCPACSEKDARIWRLETELHRLVKELIDTAADLAVAEGAPTE